MSVNRISSRGTELALKQAVRVTIGPMIGACGTIEEFRPDGKTRVSFVGGPTLIIEAKYLDPGVPWESAFPDFPRPDSQPRPKRARR